MKYTHLQQPRERDTSWQSRSVIAAASSGAARVLGAGAELGTVAVGRRADLLLLDASPVEDIRNTRRIRMVIHRGRIVDRTALLQLAREQQDKFP